jgi:hypothetical protein
MGVGRYRVSKALLKSQYEMEVWQLRYARHLTTLDTEGILWRFHQAPAARNWSISVIGAACCMRSAADR